MATLLQNIKGFFTSKPQRLALHQEPAPISPSATAATIQGALRSAETGDTRNLFTLYRDIAMGNGHVQSEMNKRKLAVLAETWDIIPKNPKKPEDVKAAEAVKEMVKLSDGFSDLVNVMMDACLWPLVVVEKIWRPTEKGETDLNLRYVFRCGQQVNPQTICFNPGYTYGSNAEDPNQWEGAVRLFPVDSNGVTYFSLGDAKYLDKNLHLLHRGHTLASMRDNWGGPMRAILGWWFLAECGRDWFGRFVERYGSPFVVGKVDAKNPTAVDFMEDAFAEATKIGGMVIDHGSEVQLVSAAASTNETAYQSFLEVCHREISKIILGQTLSADAQPTGLGSGVAKLHSDVREDFKRYDRQRLADTLRRQLFAQFLQMNAIKGGVPNIVWGGLGPEDAKITAELLVSLKNSGFRATDEAIPTIAEKIGFPIERTEQREIGPDGVIRPIGGNKEEEQPTE